MIRHINPFNLYHILINTDVYVKLRKFDSSFKNVASSNLHETQMGHGYQNVMIALFASPVPDPHPLILEYTRWMDIDHVCLWNIIYLRRQSTQYHDEQFMQI